MATWKGALLKSGAAFKGQSVSPVMDLYRRICKEIPRVMTIYDIDMDTAVVSIIQADPFGKPTRIEQFAVAFAVESWYLRSAQSLLSQCWFAVAALNKWDRLPIV